MESNLEKAIVGLRLAAQFLEWPYDKASYFMDDDEICESADLCRPSGCRGEQIDNCLPRDETETERGTIKKSRLSSKVLPSTCADVQPETQAYSCSTHFSTVADSGFDEKRRRHVNIEAEDVTTNNSRLDASNIEEEKRKDVESSKRKFEDEKNCEKSSMLQPFTSTDYQPESQTSSCSTHFSGVEDSGFDNRFELQSRNIWAKETSFVQLPAIRSTIPNDDLTVKPLYFVRLLLEALESETLVVECTMISRWHGTMAKNAVDAIVVFADSTCAEETTQLCRTEVVKSIERVYERFLKSSDSRALGMDTLWIDHFTILLTLCKSKSICEEFVKFFVSHLITPKNVEDLEDPKQIVEGLIMHDKARFNLNQLHNLLRRYTKPIKESGYETNIHSAGSQQASPNLQRFLQSTKNRDDIKLEEYAVKNTINFPVLAYIATRNLTLLKSRISL